mmetsp:Transcript_3071/g.6265  ORF Transcript_3071/g.6265 Transcript_3071/m.6265 type:complete len:166 (-) Transcript_3071:905-1402(-)
MLKLYELVLHHHYILDLIGLMHCYDNRHQSNFIFHFLTEFCKPLSKVYPFLRFLSSSIMVFSSREKNSFRSRSISSTSESSVATDVFAHFSHSTLAVAAEGISENLPWTLSRPELGGNMASGENISSSKTLQKPELTPPLMSQLNDKGSKLTVSLAPGSLAVMFV